MPGFLFTQQTCRYWAIRYWWPPQYCWTRSLGQYLPMYCMYTYLPHSVMFDKELAATFHMESDSRVCTLQCRHNEHDGVSNHRRLDCLLKRLVRHRSKKTSKLHVTGLCVGNPPPVTSGFPHKGPVTRKIFPFGDVIMAMHDRMRKLIIGFSYSIC